jgi:DNA-binding transcriptional LysR family regulator
LYRGRFVLLGTPALAERMRDCSSDGEFLDQLASEAIVSYAGDLPILRRFWSDAFAAEIVAEPALIAPDLRAVVVAVANGLGVSVVPAYLCADAVMRGEVAILKDAEAESSNELLLGWNRHAISCPGVAFLRGHFVAEFAA